MTLFVRALYDYQAEDSTSLSFRQGDIIQLESGWWDGVINGVRGWFPSNYCEVVEIPTAESAPDINGHESGGDRTLLAPEEEYDGDEYEEVESEGNAFDEGSPLPIEGTEPKEQEEAAFWIPQATPDGRLFYFNTLTGVSTMELPLETPLSSNETGPRDRTNIFIPDNTRPPPEMMAGGYERDEDTDYENSASEAEGMVASRGSLPRRRRSYISDGVSPATSIDSLNQAAANQLGQNRSDLSDMTAQQSFSVVRHAIPPIGTTMTSFANSPSTQAAGPPRLFFDGNATQLTWPLIGADLHRAVDRYRQAIRNGERAQFVKCAEDISDHVRVLLAAGSGTTDNHSGNPSIISSNKALYPHFREMMQRLSKLVLSSHIAAADFPAQDSYSKCLLEADGLMNGVYAFIDVARQQRGEEIPRITPGFVAGSYTGGSWQNNGLVNHDSSTSMSFIDHEFDDNYSEPTIRLDSRILERLEELRKMIATSIRKLDEHLVVRDKLITPYRHQVIGDNVCKAAGKIIEFYRPWISTVESINLAPVGSSFQNPQIADFSTHKQRVYDMTAELIIACQAVGAPLGDEWSAVRGDSLEDRLNSVRVVVKDLETVTQQVFFSLQLLLEMMPTPAAIKEEHRKTDGGATYEHHLRTTSKQIQRPLLADVQQSHSYSEGIDPAQEHFRTGDNSKLRRFFGEVPAPMLPNREVEDIPEFLKLDHEGELSFDTKTDPPTLKGGTLTALVEQLTRHDKLDSSFNNTFLLTYRSFTTANELFELLVKRWSIQPPPGLAKEDYQIWQDKKQKPIRFRVVNILKSWFTDFWMEGNDEASKEVIQRVLQFAKDTVAATSTPGANPLIAAVEQRAKGQDAPKKLVATINTQIPQPILPKNMKRLKFLDIDVLEFARQLTIIESKLYAKIKPTECLNKTWHRKLDSEKVEGEPDPAENVKRLILHSNQLTNWVAEMILTQQDVKKRVIVIKHFVLVADKCRNLNNFSSMTSIISALGTAPIHRLQRTWGQVSARTLATLESMRKLMSSTKNFLEYRDTLHKAAPPCIPFLGVYLTDLTFIEDGIPSTIKKTSLINFAKRAKTAELIREIQSYQKVNYGLQPVPELQEYILENMRTAGDVHEMYDRSLAVEPREREDEKIARYRNILPPFVVEGKT